MSSVEGKQETMSCFFPHNVVEDILARLDVKALVRFKGVSKSWFNLISNHCFQDLHRLRSQDNLYLLLRSTTFSYNHLDHPNHQFAYQFCSTRISRPSNIHTRFTAKMDGPIKLVLPSCRGLVCLATETRIYVCNPATFQLVALPTSPNPGTLCGFGFGYIETNKCYRVVRLIYRRSIPRIECSVLQLQSGSWRVLEEGCPYFVDEFSYPAFAKETIHWKIRRSQVRRDRDYILCFNIKDKKFTVIPHPPDWRYISHNSTQVVELGGMLCMVEISTSNVAIWVHRYNQWHKAGLIDLRGIDRRFVGELKCLKDGEIVFSSLSDQFLLYDIKNKRFRRLPIPFRGFALGIYWENLFSLPDSH